MQSKADIRKPKQKRSLAKKQCIVESAKALYIKQGYYNTTTNEIAKGANVSIGTLYAYFADKEAILAEVMQQVNTYFFTAFDFMDEESDAQLFINDTQTWLQKMLESLLYVQEAQKDISREIKSLRHTVPMVEDALEAQNEHMYQATAVILSQYQKYLACGDLEATAILLVDFIDALISKITFTEDKVWKQRLINAGAEALYKMIRK